MHKRTQMIELVPVTELATDEEVNAAAHSILSSHMALPNSRLLRVRGLQHFKGENGIYDRGFSPEQPNGLKTVFAEREAMHGGLRQTYLLRTEVNTERHPFLGVAGIDPQARLRQQKIGGKLGRIVPILSTEMHPDGPRLHAWAGDIYGHAGETDQYQTLTAAYTELLEKGGEGSWTVEPAAAPTSVHQAIEDAGLRPVGEVSFYNDFRSERPVMPGILYQS